MRRGNTRLARVTIATAMALAVAGAVAAGAQDTPESAGTGATTDTPARPADPSGGSEQATTGGADDDVDDVDPTDAQPAAPTQPAQPVYDYSRFSDGPRRVPAARGPAFERARRLGLGTRETATHLLTRPPERRWMRAVRGRSPTALLWPATKGWFGRGFGLTRRVRRDLPHNGIDMAGPVRSPIRAAADGIVAYSDNGIRGYGNCVLVVHANGWVTLYGHNYRNVVQAGYRVHRGEKIAEIGSTGIAHGPHLHFELRDNGRLRDPVRLFPRVPRRARDSRTVARPRDAHGAQASARTPRGPG